MDINRTLPTFGREVSGKALQQVAEYTNAPPFKFSFQTSCCKSLRQNPDLVDPGYYLNGGPSCQQMGLSCADPHQHQVEALADGLIPGSFVFAPIDERTFWPAIVDFSPEGESQFVIFHFGGLECCCPYAYYVSFVPGRMKERFGGWFTVDNIIPFDTMIQKPIDLDHNHNDPNFDYAYNKANQYYAESLVERMAQFSFVYNVQIARERESNRKRTLKGELAKQAWKISRGLLQGITPTTYTRVDDCATEVSAASSSTTNVGKFAQLLKKKNPSPPGSADTSDIVRDYYGVFSTMPLSDLLLEQNHIHDSVQPPTAQSPTEEIVEQKLIPNNPTEHWETAKHEVRHRTAIAAILKCGLQRIRVFQPYAQRLPQN